MARRAAHQTPQPTALATKIGFAALALLAAGLALQLAGLRGFTILGSVLWFCGILAVAGQALCFWRNLNASH